MNRIFVICALLGFSVLLSDKAQAEHRHHHRHSTYYSGGLWYTDSFPGYGYSNLGYSGFNHSDLDYRGSGYRDFGYRNPGYPRHGYPSYGFGYVYDPYARGSFEAPDLLNDPLFQAQHKFDSRYPGRYQSASPLQFKDSSLNEPVRRSRHRIFGRNR
ncbi:hypothetical protein Pla22_43090 [Rubripirellula amarantea]|uniref:Uncharacterized protein n=1 Tax=Rubripirellula amarantea TaxID=2527999 RepID=A0A5C5WF14_9BACT|nr:hypothetical protein [Rubripirellula amarantea]TWT49117.1 hypothetical protein Pla22_43090 [Rubripirellula amarantea]